MLMMKCPSSKGGGDEQTICNLTIVNLSLCVDIEIVKEMLPLENVQPPEPINIQKVNFLYLFYEPSLNVLFSIVASRAIPTCNRTSYDFLP